MGDVPEDFQQTHRTDIPGLAGGAAFCTECSDYCGGDYERCVHCGGKGTGARAEELAREEAEKAARGEAPSEAELASGAPVPGGTQVSPQTGPGRVQDYPVAPRPGDGSPGSP